VTACNNDSHRSKFGTSIFIRKVIGLKIFNHISLYKGQPTCVMWLLTNFQYFCLFVRNSSKQREVSCGGISFLQLLKQTRKRGNCECIATWGRPSHASPFPLRRYAKSDVAEPIHCRIIFGTEFHHVTGDTLRMFKVKGQRSRSHRKVMYQQQKRQWISSAM